MSSNSEKNIPTCFDQNQTSDFMCIGLKKENMVIKTI